MPDTSLPNEVAQFHLRDRLARVDWAKRREVMTIRGWRLYVDPGDMPEWYAWIRRAQQAVVVSTETYLILSGHGPALRRFLDDIVDWPKNGLIRLPIDGVYQQAGLVYAAATGNDVVRAKDAITALEERAQRLLYHASDLADAPSDRLLNETVVAELIVLDEEMQELETRMLRLRQVVQLARLQAHESVV